MWGDGMIVVLNDRQFGKNIRFLRRRHRYSRWELANLILVFNKTVKNRFIRLLFQQPAA